MDKRKGSEKDREDDSAGQEETAGECVKDSS